MQQVTFKDLNGRTVNIPSDQLSVFIKLAKAQIDNFKHTGINVIDCQFIPYWNDRLNKLTELQHATILGYSSPLFSVNDIVFINIESALIKMIVTKRELLLGGWYYRLSELTKKGIADKRKHKSGYKRFESFLISDNNYSSNNEGINSVINSL